MSLEIPDKKMPAKQALVQLRLKEYVIVSLLWFFFQVVWYVSFGVHFELEAGKYIGEAHYLLQHHHFSVGRFLFYSATIFIIAFCYLTNLGLYGALLIVMIINLLSYLYFYKALRHFFTDKLSPLLVIVSLLSFWPYQSWSLYLYTECLFYSAVVLLFAHLLLFRNFSAGYSIVAGLLLLLVVLSRPLGILFVPPTLIFFFFKLSGKQKIFFAGAVIIAMIALNYIVQVVFTTTSDWNMQRAITEGDIICDIPGTPASHLILTNHPNQLYQLFYYITHNFSHFVGLAIIRLQYFFTMVRSYYSPFHNLYLIVYLLFWYGCILVGLKKIWKHFPLSVLAFMFSSILLFALTIALQCDDYHNRFFLTLAPFFATMSVVVMEPLLHRLRTFSVQRKG